MKKVSIIIPVYNVENYLAKCLDSVISQTYKNIEILLINDGSTDSSLDICERYRQIDSRVIVINKKNSGVSASRNKGLSQATGDYIMFIDSDDWIERDYVYEAEDYIEKNNFDFVRCSYVREQKNRSIDEEQVFEGDEENDSNGEEFLSRIVRGEIRSYVWLLIIKSEVIQKFNICFNEKMKIYEDLLFYVDLLKYNCKFGILNIKKYHYIYRTNSALGNNKNFQEKLKSYVTLNQEIRKRRLGEKINEIIDYRLMVAIDVYILNTYKYDKKSLINNINKVEELIKGYNLINYLNKLDYRRKKTIIFSIDKNIFMLKSTLKIRRLMSFLKKLGDWLWKPIVCITSKEKVVESKSKTQLSNLDKVENNVLNPSKSLSKRRVLIIISSVEESKGEATSSCLVMSLKCT